MQIQQSETQFLRVEVHRNGSRTYLFVASIAGTTAKVLKFIDVSPFLPASNSPMLLKVARLGTSWTIQYAPNELNWSIGYTVVANLTVSAVALYAGSSAGNTHTSLVDYLKVSYAE